MEAARSGVSLLSGGSPYLHHIVRNLLRAHMLTRSGAARPAMLHTGGGARLCRRQLQPLARGTAGRAVTRWRRPPLPAANGGGVGPRLRRPRFQLALSRAARSCSRLGYHHPRGHLPPPHSPRMMMLIGAPNSGVQGGHTMILAGAILG